MHRRGPTRSATRSRQIQTAFRRPGPRSTPGGPQPGRHDQRPCGDVRHQSEQPSPTWRASGPSSGVGSCKGRLEEAPIALRAGLITLAARSALRGEPGDGLRHIPQGRSPDCNRDLGVEARAHLARSLARHPTPTLFCSIVMVVRQDAVLKCVQSRADLQAWRDVGRKRGWP